MGQVQAIQQLSHSQHRPDPGAKACSGTEGIPGKCLYGLPAESSGRQRPSRKGRKQPKQLNKYTGGSWQTEATRRASFRLSHVLSPQQGSSTAGSRLGGHTHTHHCDKPHGVKSQGHLCLASTQLQQPAHKFSRAQEGGWSCCKVP